MMPHTPAQRRAYYRKAENRTAYQEVLRQNRESGLRRRRTAQVEKARDADRHYTALALTLRRQSQRPGFISPQYLAGFIDGEGWIGIVKSSNSPAIAGRICVANTDVDVLARIRDQLGVGRLYLNKRDKPHHRPFGLLVWTSRDALFVLRWVLPHLIVKRPQALLCAELIGLKLAPREERYSGLSLRPDVIARQNEIAAQLATLNARPRP